MRSKALNLVTLISREALHLLGAQGPCCRFEPTCSAYFRQSLTEHGLFRGTRYGISRILRCGPFGGSGWDPVPCVKHGKNPTRLLHSGEQA